MALPCIGSWSPYRKWKGQGGQVRQLHSNLARISGGHWHVSIHQRALGSLFEEREFLNVGPFVDKALRENNTTPAFQFSPRAFVPTYSCSRSTILLSLSLKQGEASLRRFWGCDGSQGWASWSFKATCDGGVAKRLRQSNP